MLIYRILREKECMGGPCDFGVKERAKQASYVKVKLGEVFRSAASLHTTIINID